MNWIDAAVAFVAGTLAGAAIGWSPVVRAILVETFRHPTKPSTIPRSDHGARRIAAG